MRCRLAAKRLRIEGSSGLFKFQCMTGSELKSISAPTPIAVQLLLGHTKLESTVRYLGTDADDALEISEQTEIWVLPQRS